MNDSILLFNTERRVCLPGFILDDNDVEGEENFRLVLTADTFFANTNLNLEEPTTTIVILDNDR